MTDHSTMKLGRRPHAPDPRVPHLAHRMSMVQPKPAVDWTPVVQQWGMLANDQHGDCTAAAALHIIQLWLANNGIEYTPTDAEALQLYSETSDYPRIDHGTTEIEVLKYRVTTGIPTSIGTDCVTFASLNPRNLDELRLSVEWFGATYLGVSLPLTAQTQDVRDIVSITGDGAPGSWGDHAIPAVAYDQQTFTVISWGKPLKVTNAFMLEYLEEAYAVVSEDWLADSGLAPPSLTGMP
jgi:hypothetical protein